MIDKKTNAIIKKFNNQKEAGNFLGTSNTSHICQVCRGKRNTAFGYKWVYINKYKKEIKENERN